MPPEIISKRIMLSVSGQSNEADSSPLLVPSYFGAPYANSLTKGGWWGYAKDKLWKESQVWCDINNTAVGASGIVQHWCGDTNFNGTGNPYNKDDVQFGATGYAEAAKDAALIASSTHEAWTYISFGQADSTVATLATFEQGMVNLIDYFLANNVNVIVGLSFYLGTSETWYDESGTPALNNVLTTYASDSRVKAGANLATELGKNLVYQGATAHPEQRGYELAGEAVGSALIEAFK